MSGKAYTDNWAGRTAPDMGVRIFMVPANGCTRAVDYWAMRADARFLRRIYRSLRRGGETRLDARRLIRLMQVIRVVA